MVQERNKPIRGEYEKLLEGKHLLAAHCSKANNIWLLIHVLCIELTCSIFLGFTGTFLMSRETQEYCSTVGYTSSRPLQQACRGDYLKFCHLSREKWKFAPASKASLGFIVRASKKGGQRYPVSGVFLPQKFGIKSNDSRATELAIDVL